MSATVSVRVRSQIGRRYPRGFLPRIAPAGITLAVMLVILLICVIMQPRVLSIVGLTLVFSSITPIVFATLAQMVIMSVGDIDLGIGAFIGLVTGICASMLTSSPLIGVLTLLGLVLAYAAVGALVQWRKVPSLIATLGASFVWLGLGLAFLPTPGGEPPAWLLAFSSWRPAVIPVPVLVMLAAAGALWFVMQRTGWGTNIRALGSNPIALSRSGASPLYTRMSAYALAGVLGILGGIVLSGEIASGDVNAANDYTLVSVAAVILGGGTFFGGRAGAWGALFGAATLGLLTVLLTLLNLPSALQSAIQGAIVFLALAGRLFVEKAVK